MKKILLVDDSETLRAQIRNDLKDEGYELLEAGNGIAGIECVQQNPDIDLIICDVNMPEMDGLTMCSELKKMADIGSVPILMLTTQASKELKAKGKENGVVAWIVKPHKKPMLVNGVAQILKRFVKN